MYTKYEMKKQRKVMIAEFVLFFFSFIMYEHVVTDRIPFAV